MPQEEITAPVSEHFNQLRRTLLNIFFCIGIGFLFSLLFYKKLFAFLLSPFDGPLVFLGPFDGFFLTFKIAFICGFVFSSPISCFFLIRFLLPGLNAREKRFLGFFSPFAFVLGLLGTILAYFFTLPLLLSFFAKFNEGIGENFWTVKEAASTVLWILASHAIAFEAIALLWFFLLYGVIKVENLKKWRPAVIVLILLASAILTPPDVLSQLCLAAPLYLLFEASLFLVPFLKRKKLN